MRHFSTRGLHASPLLAALLFAVGADAQTAYVGNFSDNSVSVIDVARGTALATIAVAAGPHGMIAAPDGRTVYMSAEGSDEIDELDTATRRLRGVIHVGKTPHGLALSPDGKWLLVAV